MWWPSSHSFATPSLFKRSSLVAQTVRSLPTSRRARFNFWVRKMPWKREQQPTAVFLPREFHAQKSLEGYSPRGHRVSDTTTQPTLFIYFALFNYRGLEYFTSTPRASCPVLYILRQASSTFKIHDIIYPHSLTLSGFLFHWASLSLLSSGSSAFTLLSLFS